MKQYIEIYLTVLSVLTVAVMVLGIVGMFVQAIQLVRAVLKEADIKKDFPLGTPVAVTAEPLKISLIIPLPA